jgi:hypothetical protein
LPAHTQEQLYPVVVAAYNDVVRGKAAAFSDVYKRLTVRGKLTSVGHGTPLSVTPGGQVRSENRLLLDGRNQSFPGFQLAQFPVPPPTNGLPYPLPFLGTHGVTVLLHHCFSAMQQGNAIYGQSPVATMKVVLSNGDQTPVRHEFGEVLGYTRQCLIEVASGWATRAGVAVPQNLTAVHAFADLYTGVQLAITPKAGPVAASEELRLPLATMAIGQNMTTGVAAVPLAPGRWLGLDDPAPGSTLQASLIETNARGVTAVRETFTYGTVVDDSVNRLFRPGLQGVAGLPVHAGPSQFSIVRPGRGGSGYHYRHLRTEWSTEGAGPRREQSALHGLLPDGRIQNFRIDGHSPARC